MITNQSYQKSGMAKGSQLKQLKSALSDVGLSRKSNVKSSSKKRKRASSAVSNPHEKDKQQKLQDIHERLNPFDTKSTKLKHDVGGRKLKGVTGKPGQSKQAGIEQRRKTLLVEYDQRDHAGGIVDRRFGENDPTMTPEERMLERFTRERQRSSKSTIYNLEEDGHLTHYGQSLSLMDDFDNAGLALDVEGEEEGNGQIDGRTVSKAHFGGFDDDEEDEEEEPPRKKSKAEVMAEVIVKSKEHKYQRQMEKEANEKARIQVDEEFDDIRKLIFSEAANLSTVTVAEHNSRGDTGVESSLTKKLPEEDQQYDQLVRELALEKRAKPKDRTKTEEEIALEEKEALEKAEKARLRRMLGEELEDGDVHGNRGRKRPRGGDDLEDDFGEESLGGLGLGLEEREGEDDEDEDEDDEDDEDDAEKSHSDSEEEDEWDGFEGDDVRVDSKDTRISQKPKTSRNLELPFTFPCPASHDEFLSILDEIESQHLGTVVHRIRALYHPRLDQDNPQKLQVFLEVMIDHVLHVASPPAPNFSLVDDMFPHIYALTKSYPVTAANACVAKLTLMHKNLLRGLSHGPALKQARTWPGTAELSLLRLLGQLWSASDMNHAVITPARILIGSYLGLARVRSVKDIANGLFLCTIVLQYEEISKRFCPEVINFLMNVLLCLVSHPFEDPSSSPGGFFIPGFHSNENLQLTSKDVVDCLIEKPNLVAIMMGGAVGSAGTRLGLLDLILILVERFAKLNRGMDGFIELYAPILEIISKLNLGGFPSLLQNRRLRLEDALQRFLQFSRTSRRPLLLQSHKPIPIASIVPKFSATTSNYLRSKDPDSQRAAASKLRRQLKEERKGAIRELRKDARFLASVQQKREFEEAENYNSRLKKVFSSIEQERSEQKASEREQQRAKRRLKSK